MKAIRTFSLFIVASLMAVSVVAADSDTKHSSLDAFHQLSVDENMKCKEQNEIKLGNIESEIRSADRKASLQYELMRQVRAYGMRDRVQELQQETQRDLDAFIVKRDAMLAELSKTSQECADEAARKLREAFSPAYDGIKKNTPSSQMLKDYFAAELTALGATVPAPNEKLLSYKERQADVATKLNDLWNRFEIEVNY